MLTIIVFSALLAILVGVVLKWFFDRGEGKKNSSYKISWFEFLICALVILLIEAPIIGWAGWKISVNGVPVTGAAAEAQMKHLVLTEETQKSYDTGIDTPEIAPHN